MDKQSAQVTAWADVEKTVKTISPDLHKIISALDPPSNYKLYRAKYAFGDLIVNQDTFQLPIENMLLAITDCAFPRNIKDDLCYNSFNIPIGISIHNQTETFVTLDNQVIPLFGMTSTGNIIGNKYNLSLENHRYHHLPYNISAGARSIFMLPKIQSQLMHRRLFSKAMQPTPVPKNLFNQWNTFKIIANLPEISNKWHCEILFFSREWFEHIDDPAWKLFKCHLFSTNSFINEFWKNIPTWNLIFSQLDLETTTSSYSVSIIKHLFKIAAGAMPGFAPTINLSVAPIDVIQDLYTNVGYKLKNHIPTVMCPEYYQNNKPVYYSFNMNTADEIASKSRQRNSLILDLFELKHCLNNYLNKIKRLNSLYAHSVLSKIPNNIDFTFYHHSNQKIHNIASCEELIAEDPRFCEAAISCENIEFAENNPFTRACVGIKCKTKT